METGEGGGQDELGFATRVKALAIADPVLDLERRKRALDRDWLGYQMEELALAAIDSVTLRMDFEEGVRFSDAAADVVRVAAAQMPSRGPAEHANVANWVLNNLINVGTVDRNFRHPYGMITDGRYGKHDFDFKILREVPGPDGEPRLRAETAAIAVLVGAVEVDIASEQVAAEAKLAALVKRGRLADAHRAAQAALRRTVQYGESLRYFLETARRDVRAVDWGRDVGGMQREALDHIEERIHAENAIRDNLLQIVDDATDDLGRRKQATGLVGILDECLKRHWRSRRRCSGRARSSGKNRPGRRSSRLRHASGSTFSPSCSPPLSGSRRRRRRNRWPASSPRSGGRCCLRSRTYRT